MGRAGPRGAVCRPEASWRLSRPDVDAVVHMASQLADVAGRPYTHEVGSQRSSATMEWKEAVDVLRTPILHGGGRHYIHAMSHFDGDSFPWYLYAHSYQSAADFLVSNLGDVDENAHYAILFLYRHSLELKLKEHIFKLDQHLDSDCPGNLSEHDLVVLWDEYLAKRGAVSERLGLDRDEAGEQDAPIAERLGELRGLDRKSAGLRYPLERDRSSSMQGVLGEESAVVVDLEQFGMLVGAMTTVLDGIGDWLESYAEAAG